MRNIISISLLLTFLTTTQAQNGTYALSQLIIYPTVTTVKLAYSTVDFFLATGASTLLASVEASSSNIEFKSTNDKKILNKQSSEVMSKLANGQEASLLKYKILSNMIEELRNSDASTHIQAEADMLDVSFEMIAVRNIYVLTN